MKHWATFLDEEEVGGRDIVDLSMRIEGKPELREWRNYFTFISSFLSYSIPRIHPCYMKIIIRTIETRQICTTARVARTMIDAITTFQPLMQSAHWPVPAPPVAAIVGTGTQGVVAIRGQIQHNCPVQPIDPIIKFGITVRCWLFHSRVFLSCTRGVHEKLWNGSLAINSMSCNPTGPTSRASDASQRT